MSLIERIKLLIPFWVFSACYFLIPFIRSPIPAPQFLINIDTVIPFVWWMIIPYYFYYIILFLPLMLSDRTKLKSFIQIATILLLISYTVFIIWPISCEKILATRTDNPLAWMHGMITFTWLYQNAFPSIHVIISCMVCLILGYEFSRQRILYWVGGGSVFFATFFIKQHFLIDSVAGLILGCIGYFFWLKKTKELI